MQCSPNKRDSGPAMESCSLSGETRSAMAAYCYRRIRSSQATGVVQPSCGVKAWCRGLKLNFCNSLSPALRCLFVADYAVLLSSQEESCSSFACKHNSCATAHSVSQPSMTAIRSNKGSSQQSDVTRSHRRYVLLDAGDAECWPRLDSTVWAAAAAADARRHAHPPM